MRDTRLLYSVMAAQAQRDSSRILSAEEGARLLLDIFVTDFQRQSGEALRVQQLSGVWYDRDRSQQDLVQAIAYAKSHEWIDPLDEAFRLTKAGYQVGGSLSTHWMDERKRRGVNR